jgi:hypothetical protein
MQQEWINYNHVTNDNRIIVNTARSRIRLTKKYKKISVNHKYYGKGHVDLEMESSGLTFLKKYANSNGYYTNSMLTDNRAAS